MASKLEAGFALLDGLPVMVAFIDRQERCVHATPAYARFFGVAPDALVGRSLRDHLGEPAYRRAAACVSHALVEGTTCLAPIPVAENPPDTYRMAYVPYCEDGETCGLFIVIEPAGEAAPQAADAVDADSALGDIVSSLPGVVFQYERHDDETGRFNYLSPQAASWADTDIDRIKANPDILIPQPHPGETEPVRQTGETWSWQGYLNAGQGRTRFVRGLARAHEPAPGRLVWNGALLDASDQKHVERMLKETAAFFHDIATTIPGVVYRFVRTADGRRRFDYVSPQITDMLGLSAQDAIADASLLLDRIHPDDRASLKSHAADTAQSLAPLNWEGRMSAADGSIRWVRCTSQPRWQSDGSIVWSGVVIDTTERKQAEEELHEARKMEAVGQLTGGLAHDFNNLIAVIDGNLELLEEDLSDRPRLQSMVSKARQAARRGSDVTRRLLAFARRQPLSPQAVDVNELVGRTAELLDRTIGPGVVLATGSLGAARPVLVDPGQLENALINLAMNARDAMPEGGEITIETGDVELGEACAATRAGVTPGCYTEISVSDTGAGMPSEVVEKAFQPFFTTKPASSSSGLGLSMVYGFVKQSGGDALIHSAEGRGTTVTLYLPQARHEVSGIPEQPRAINEPKAASGECVLLLEMEQELRASLAAMLTQLGYQLLIAGDVESALAQADTAPRIDLLISDITPGENMSGPQLAKMVQARRDIAVLITFGYQDAPIGDDLNGIAEVPLLRQPVSRSELANRVRAAIDAHGRGS